MSAYVIQDSATMLRRNFRHMVRYPSVSLLVLGIPVILLLLFVFVFGGTLGDGLGVAASGRAAYVDYVTPAIVLIAIAGAAQGTAISVAMDMHEGIIASSARWASPVRRYSRDTCSAARSRRWADSWS